MYFCSKVFIKDIVLHMMVYTLILDSVLNVVDDGVSVWEVVNVMVQ